MTPYPHTPNGHCGHEYVVSDSPPQIFKKKNVSYRLYLPVYDIPLWFLLTDLKKRSIIFYFFSYEPQPLRIVFSLYVPDFYTNATVTKTRVLIVILSVEYSCITSVTGGSLFTGIIVDDVYSKTFPRFV